MSHATGTFAFCLGCLLAGPGAAGDEIQPDEALLEFLGSWSGEDDDADWFEFLANLPDGQRDLPPGDTDDDRTNDNEPR
jgi:hypothetical protein